MLHEFHLSPPGTGRGMSCDANGAFIGDIPLLKRLIVDGKERWEARECSELSKEIGGRFGLPIDMASKMGGVRAISNALNEGDVARAQIATVLLGIPDPPALSKGVDNRADLIKFIDDLHWSGLLKADWDPDEHPRWPAGAPNSQGGQFAPKSGDTSADHSAGESAELQRPAAATRDREFSAYRQLFDAPSNIPSALQSNDEGTRIPILDGNGQSAGNASNGEHLGIFERYGHHIGGTQLAATSIPMEGLGITEANPANWANLTRLASGALRLGSGQIITAASLLTAADVQRERAAVDAAIDKFGFDPTNAADVLAVRAYVWAQHWAPLNYDVPWSGPQLESVSQSIMALELARPGTLYLALQGDEASTRCMRAAVEDGIKGGAIFESRARPRNLPAALQTSIPRARAALGLQTNDQMRAHHLIPANVWAAYLHITTLAHKAGWEPDMKDNLIALPANEAMQAKLAAGGLKLPIHSSSHPKYDIRAGGEIIKAQANYGNTLTPAQALAVYEKVEERMEDLIIAGEWMPTLY
jgi:hypothetical protein